MRSQSGSEYMVYDAGLSPSKTALETNVRCVLAAVAFAYDEMGPGRFTVRAPRVQTSGAAERWPDTGGEAGDAVATKADGVVLRNKQPEFDAKTGGHVLDFRGRVTMPSIKNFQLQCDVRGRVCSVVNSKI